MIKWMMVGIMSAATVAALIAIIMPAVANATAPSKSDTIQTWTCRWKGAVGAPENFEPLCRESVCDVLSSFSWFLSLCLLTRYTAIFFLRFHSALHRSSSALNSGYSGCCRYAPVRAAS